MKVELQNVRIFKEDSKQSTAFVGHLLADGRKIAVCTNQGDGKDSQILYNSLSSKLSFEAYALARGLDPETVLRHLLSIWQLQVACRTRTLFRLKGDRVDLWREIPTRFTPDVRAQLVARFENIEIIANEVYSGTA